MTLSGSNVSTFKEFIIALTHTIHILRSKVNFNDLHILKTEDNDQLNAIDDTKVAIQLHVCNNERNDPTVLDAIYN